RRREQGASRPGARRGRRSDRRRHRRRSLSVTRSGADVGPCADRPAGAGLRRYPRGRRARRRAAGDRDAPVHVAGRSVRERALPRPARRRRTGADACAHARAVKAARLGLGVAAGVVIGEPDGFFDGGVVRSGGLLCEEAAQGRLGLFVGAAPKRLVECLVVAEYVVGLVCGIVAALVDEGGLEMAEEGLMIVFVVETRHGGGPRLGLIGYVRRYP